MRAQARVGRYRLSEVLGVGSFATVHLAIDDRLDAEVVVKILAENHSLNPEIRERFIAEGRSLRKVDNPHVVTVHDIGESEHQQPYLVLEYVDRGTLADRIEILRAAGWRATRAEILDVARNLASALSAVHAAGLVHRDLSPRNVLIKSDPHERASEADRPVAPSHRQPGRILDEEKLVVADLGMCKDLALNSGLTVAGGTAGFRPPEQQGGPAIIDHRADLWAMSQLLTWVSTGADLPKAFFGVLERSLATNPNRRHADAQAWLAAIEGALRDPASPAAPNAQAVSAQVVSAQAVSRPRRGVRLLAVVAALALAFVAGSFLPGWWGDVWASDVIVIEGPSRISVGEEASFRAVVDGAESWVWILPNGTYVANVSEVRLTPSTSGSAQVLIAGKDTAGNAVEATKRVIVE